MEETNGITEETMRADRLKIMRHQEVVKALQSQLDNYGPDDFALDYTREHAAAELQATLPALADAINSMSEEAGAACYMAARMLRECYWLIKCQQGFDAADHPRDKMNVLAGARERQEETDRKAKESWIVQMGQSKMDMTGTVRDVHSTERR